MVRILEIPKWDYARCGCTLIITHAYCVHPSVTGLINIFIVSWA